MTEEQDGSNFSEIMENVLEKSNDYDFTRFTWCDAKGNPRTRVIKRGAVEKILKFGGIDLADIPVRNMSAKFMYPADDTIRACPWVGQKSGKKFCEVMCYLHDNDTPGFPVVSMDTRFACARQLHGLDKEHNMSIISTFDYSVSFSEGGGADVNGGADSEEAYSAVALKKSEDFLMLVSDRLEKAGINLESIHACSNGIIKLKIDPASNILGPDNAFLLRSCLKESAVELNVQATPASEGFFKFSLWRQGKNLFYDAESPNKLSQTAESWIAGIVKHLDGLLDLADPQGEIGRKGPTGESWKFWDIWSLDCFLNIKNRSEPGCCVEVKFCSGRANPYLVATAIIAAGIDGMNNELKAPEMGERWQKAGGGSGGPGAGSGKKVKALRKNEVLIAALGKDIVDLL